MPQVLLRKAQEYLNLAIQKEKEKKFDSAKDYYFMAAKALLEAAKESGGKMKEIRLKNAEKLIRKADSMPAMVKEGEGHEIKPISPERSRITFDDVAGLDDVKEKIRDLIITPLLYPEKAEKWKVRAGGGMLLYGPPGTGKTHLGRAVAGEIDAEFYYVKASDIVSKWFGESEKRVAELFRKAREGKSVVFIDEVDALLPKRTASTSSVMPRIVSQFLNEMDGIDKGNLLIIGATNIPWSIDPAALRPGRFDFKFYIPPPDFEARKRIFQLNLDVPNDVDFDVLAERSDGYSGADIKLICDEAKRMMMKKEIESGEEVVMRTEDVISVMEKFRPSIDVRDLRKYEEWLRKDS